MRELLFILHCEFSESSRSASYVVEWPPLIVEGAMSRKVAAMVVAIEAADTEEVGDDGRGVGV